MNGDDGLLDEYTIKLQHMTNPIDMRIFPSTKNLGSALANAMRRHIKTELRTRLEV